MVRELVVLRYLLKRLLLGKNRYEGATCGKVVDLIASTLANQKLSFWGLHLHILIMWRSRVLGASV